jgi:hypothetical protein
MPLHFQHTVPLSAHPYSVTRVRLATPLIASLAASLATSSMQLKVWWRVASQAGSALQWLPALAVSVDVRSGCVFAMVHCDSSLVAKVCSQTNHRVRVRLACRCGSTSLVACHSSPHMFSARVLLLDLHVLLCSLGLALALHCTAVLRCSLR